VGGPDHHHEAAVGLVSVVVIDGGDVKEVLALVTSDEGLVAVEAKPRTSTFRHLLGGEALEGTWQ
jgi:hypothetical protein